MQQHYLTAEGAENLRKELENLKTQGREEIAQRLRAAISQGDLSENADYVSAKEDQSFMEGHILELEQIMSNVVIIDDLKQDLSEVGIGDHVTIQEGEFPPETYHIVGPTEANPKLSRISNESPIGRALLGRRVGDIVTADAPDGSFQFKILKIE